MTDVLSEITKDANRYGEKMVQIPAPRFIIFYNGIKKRPEREVLKLSDMFEMPTDDHQLELKALLLNINKGFK